MRVSKEELIAVLAQFNPWWRGEPIADLPDWQRAASRELSRWINHPPVHRAILLSGARQVGKTTLLLQQIDALLKQGVPAANILYATFDHPVLKLAGIEAVLEAWREREPRVDGSEFLFLDEAQFIRDWGLGSNTKSISTNSAALYLPARSCPWWKPTRNLASVVGIPFG